VRPQEDLGWEDPEEPHAFEDLISVLGATPVMYRGRVMCCGFPVLFVKEPTANRIAAMSQGVRLVRMPRRATTMNPAQMLTAARP
jgi:heterodisulfide reductase subunit B